MTPKEKKLMYVKIIERADKLDVNFISRLTALMDLEFADKTFNLRLEEFLNADDNNFIHDFVGIQLNIDRRIKEFGYFVPRFASVEIKNGDLNMNTYTEEMINEVEELNNNTPNGMICDADTILADIIENCDFEFTGIAQDIFNIWKNSTDNRAVELMFYEFTDMEFIDYLEKCKKEITR